MKTDQAMQVLEPDRNSLDFRYTRRLQPDPSGGYTATIHEFPGCIAEGDTAEEALANLETTALSWIEAAEANNYPVAKPVDYEGCSGKIALRISRRLHQLAAERADLEGVSLNQFIGNSLAYYLGQQDAWAKVTKEMDKTVQSTLSAIHASLYYIRNQPSAQNYIYANPGAYIKSEVRDASSYAGAFILAKKALQPIYVSS